MLTSKNKNFIFNFSNFIPIVKQNFISDDLPALSPSYTSRNLLKQKNIDIYGNETGIYSIFSEIRYPYILRKVFKKTSYKNAEIFCDYLLKKGYNVLITPINNLSIRYGVVNTLEDFKSLWDKFTQRYSSVKLEVYQKGDPFKIFFKGRKILGIYALVPAYVIGDGTSTLIELISKLSKDREHNVLYKNYPVKNINRQLDLSMIPQEREVVQLKESKLISAGASFVNLTSVLINEYQCLVNSLDDFLPAKDFTEITCFSENIKAGANHVSFYISDINQNKIDLRKLVSCYSTREQVNTLLEVLKKNSFNAGKGMGAISSLSTPNVYCRGNARSILRNAAGRLGLEFKDLGAGLRLIKERESGKKVFFSYGMSQYTTIGARSLSNNKILTKKTLLNNGINTPVGKSFKILELDKAIDFIDFLKHPKWVLKPLYGSGGVGVTTGITNKYDLIKAWNICEDLIGCNRVVLEEEVSGQDYRIVVIQNSVFSVTQRVAAYVIGDGVNTIEQLVQRKAKQRELNPFYATKKFKINSVMINFLVKKGLRITDIPPRGAKVELLDAVNIGSGGESIDKTNFMHPDWINVSIKTRKIIKGAYHIGLDLMAEDISLSPNDQKWSILEVNTNPDLGLVLFPGSGISRDIGVALLNSVFGGFSPKEKRSYELTILGRVQNVGFRKWFKLVCEARGVFGKVWNDENRKDIVKAIICGYVVPIEEIVLLSYTGPKRAIVQDVILKEVENGSLTENRTIFNTFEVLIN